MLQLFRKQRMWGRHDLKPSYDVVIIGAGVHGLATAYSRKRLSRIRKQRAKYSHHSFQLSNPGRRGVLQ